ncbi:methylated-DNA--[protein]-cysteine S-methyltransferase [Brevundimonas sp.]|uniref:methylated-DNA--[protein]-cysteine S-methyltransferase n=1 Tax=Brevundimonas sp. TaxID=1871086 RepID=UPI00391875CD
MGVTLTLSRIDSPIGALGLAADADGVVRGVSFGGDPARVMRRDYPGAAMEDGPAPTAVTDALAAYFGGAREALARVRWAVEGHHFNARVWRELARAPAGMTISYGEMARRAGEPGAAQAAGVALNRNPIPLILPCHRVIGAGGALVGFGGGLEMKTWLLRHEGALLI